MNRIPMLPLAFALSAAAAAAPQEPLEGAAIRVPGAIKHAGTYHVATGLWTRTSGQVANFGPDTVYSNTASSGYFLTAGGAGGQLPMSTNIDEGSIPAVGNTNFPLADRDAYAVNCLELGYCDLGASGSAGWEISFYNSYTPCTFNGLPDHTLSVTGLPATGCWTVALDLSGGNEFCLAGDGGDGFDNVPDLDTFGWSFRFIGADGSQPAGFIAAGDPANTDPSWVPGGIPSDGSGYYRTAPFPCGPGATTGLFTRDGWWIEDPAGVASNCYGVGGYSNMATCSPSSSPYASFYMEIQADTTPCSPSPLAFEYCFSNPNSTGQIATIDFAGLTSISANALRMTANLPQNVFGFFITSQTQGFTPNPAGSQGNLCVAGNLGRFVGPGQIQSAGTSGEITLDTTTGVWDLAAIPSAMGPYTPMVGSSNNFQAWFRDSGSIPTSNFTNGYEVVWTP